MTVIESEPTVLVIVAIGSVNATRCSNVEELGAGAQEESGTVTAGPTKKGESIQAALKPNSWRIVIHNVMTGNVDWSHQ